jgi:hypothetical protein
VRCGVRPAPWAGSDGTRPPRRHDPALLTEVAALIRDPANRRLITIGPVSVSHLGTAGLVAAGGEPTTALARELVAEWPPADQSDFARLMTSSGAAWPPGA